MTCLKQICRSAPLIFTVLLFVFSSCAYFNTFYNARQYFEQAEKQRLEKAGESIPPGAIDAYGKVIDKSQYVIDKYPDSKLVKEALLLIGMSRFHRKEYRIAETVFKQYVETYADDVDQAEYWLALYPNSPVSDVCVQFVDLLLLFASWMLNFSPLPYLPIMPDHNLLHYRPVQQFYNRFAHVHLDLCWFQPPIQDTQGPVLNYLYPN